MSTATLTDDAALDQISQDESDIRALLARIHQAHHDKDAATIAAQFVPDAAIYNLAPPLLHRGIDVQEKQNWLDSWDGPVEIVPRDLKVTVSGDSAFCYGYLQLNGNPKAAAGRHISFWMRWTVCLGRQEGSWRIVHEHASVPFYMDGEPRAAFDLQPS